jgi:hypothetical protein
MKELTPLDGLSHVEKEALIQELFRKVANGLRSEWGAELFAQVRSLVNTAKRQGISAFDAISCALTSQQTDGLLS